MQGTSIYVGVNGSGKSYTLGSIASKALEDGKPVVAISMSLNDKFPRKKKGSQYQFMGAKQGRTLYDLAIEKAIVACNRVNKPVQVNSLLNILKYAGYEETIGFNVKGFNWSFEDLFKSDLALNKLNEDKREILFSICLAYRRIHNESSNENVHWITRYSKFGSYSAVDIDSRYGEVPTGEILSELLHYQKDLKKLRIIQSVKIFFKKALADHMYIGTNAMSSGELSLIATAFFLNFSMLDGTVLLIDEPENSLHPDWQLGYLSRLKDLFPYTNFECHIATHSPMIVSGAQKEESIKIYKYEEGSFKQISTKSSNIEDALIDQFGIVTPKNNALSERCIDLINNVINQNLTQKSALEMLDIYKEASYEKQQVEFLEGVKKIINEVGRT